jgi:hypothetical protein
VQATPAYHVTVRDRDLIFCCALGCANRRARPGATHCRMHEVEWHAIQRHQRDLITLGLTRDPRELAALKQRRVATGMAWPPRNFR